MQRYRKGTMYDNRKSSSLICRRLIFYLLTGRSAIRLDEVSSRGLRVPHVIVASVYSSSRWGNPRGMRVESLAVTSRKLDKLVLHLFRSIPPRDFPPRARRTGATRRFLATCAWQGPRKIVARP